MPAESVEHQKERALASKALPISDLPAFLDDLDAIVWEADAETLDFTYVNRAAERVLGYPIEAWLETPGFWARILHPEDRAAAIRFCRSQIEQRRDHTFEYRAVHREGRPVWLRDIVRVITEPSTGRVRLRGAMVDVTRRRLAEESLRDSEERYRLLAEHIEDLMVLVDEESRILYVSPSIRTLFGRDEEQVLGTPAMELVVDEDRSEVADALRSVQRGQRAVAVEFRGALPDGGTRWFEAKGWRVKPELGSRDLRVVAVIRDISERKQLQEELERAGRMEALGRLAGGIAHDFNNLLTVIRGHGDLARSAPDASAGVEELDELLRAVDRAQDLTGQLLAFSRRNPDSRPSVVELGGAIRDTVPMLQRLMGGGVEIQLNLPDAPVHVRIDPGHLEQIVMNLAANARDAMARGGTLRIRVGDTRIRRNGGSERRAVLECQDEGSGMDRGTLSRVFEPFFTTKTEGEGTGLGMSIVYGLVGQATGELELSSEPGVGTRIRIDFPLVVDAAEAATPRESEGARPPEPPSPPLAVPGRRVLVAEDEPQLRRLVSTILRRAGYEVTVAGSAEEAWEAFCAATHPFDILLTDIIMPKESGVELADRIRTKAPELPILFMTGYPGDTLPGERELPEKTHLLAKPFTPDELQERLGGLIERSRRPADPAS